MEEDENNIKVVFIYESNQEIKIQCKKIDKIGEIFNKFSEKIQVDINSVAFLSDGKLINEADHNKQISVLHSSQTNFNEIKILVYKKIGPEILIMDSNIKKDDKNIKITFWFQSRPNQFELPLNRKTSDILRAFAAMIGKEFDSISFSYRNRPLDITKTIGENAEQIDLENKKMEIFVQEAPVEEIGEIHEEDKSFFVKNKILIISLISAAAIILIALIIIIIIFVKKKSEKNDNPIIKSFESCLIYINSTTGECEKCVDEYLLKDRKCLPYIFHAKYQVDYYNENIKLFNPDKINNIYSMKINNEIIDPKSEYDFNIIGINEIYFYYLENDPISLSKMFENIDKLVSIQFNEYDIQDFIITDMKNTGYLDIPRQSVISDYQVL